MSTHTPGNWEVSGDGIVTDDICIATVETDGGYEAPSEEREANKCLISAAPDLLKAIDHHALRMVFGEIEDSKSAEGNRLWAQLQVWFEIRDAAMRKATTEVSQ